MKRHISAFLMILVFLFSCAIPTISVFAEYDFDSMTLEEVKKLEKAAGDYYDEMTKVTSAADKEIENLIATEVGKYFNGTVSNPLFGYSVKRARNVYTLNDTVKVKDANNKTTKHKVEAEFLFNKMMTITKLVVDGTHLISINVEEVPVAETSIEYAKDLVVNRFIAEFNAKSIYEISNISKGNIRTKYFCSANNCYIELINANNAAAECFCVTINGGQTTDDLNRMFKVFGEALGVLDPTLTEAQIADVVKYLEKATYMVNDFTINENLVIETYLPILEQSYGKTSCRIDIAAYNYK